jgi:hypothetical protein
MKKLLIGCGVLVLVLAIVAGWAFWQFVWKPGSELMGEGLKTVTETVQRAQGLGETTARLRELEEGIQNQDVYAPPADGLIGPDQLARWLTVELTAREAIAADLQRLEDEASQSVTAPEATAAGNAERVRAGLAALNQLGAIAIRGKEAQVAALNAAGMSLAEYHWVRDTGLAALVAGGMSVGLEQLGQTAQQAEQARRALEEAGKAMEGVAPELRGVLERLPGLLPGGPDPQPKEPTGTDEGGSQQAAPQTGEAQAPTAPTDPARDAAARANFELVKDHAEAFAGARMLSVLGI